MRRKKKEQSICLDYLRANVGISVLSGNPLENTEKMANSLPVHLWEALSPDRVFSSWVKGEVTRVGEQLKIKQQWAAVPTPSMFCTFLVGRNVHCEVRGHSSHSRPF